MRPRTYTSEGIVLARKDYSEADRILIIYSLKYGKISVMAKGVRKPKSRKRGSLEVFSHIKYSAARGKNLDIITETEAIETFTKLRKDLKKVAVAYFFLETIGRTTKEYEENRELYNHLLSNIKELEESNNLKTQREKFIKDTLTILGFWPKDREMENPDKVLENIVEKKISSIRVGKKLLA